MKYLAAALVAGLFSASAVAQTAPGARGGAAPAAAKTPFDIWIHGEITAAFNDMRETGDVDKTRDRLANAFELVMSRGSSDKQLELLPRCRLRVRASAGR